jgi:hypothetical protein
MQNVFKHFDDKNLSMRLPQEISHQLFAVRNANDLTSEVADDIATIWKNLLFQVRSNLDFSFYHRSVICSFS